VQSFLNTALLMLGGSQAIAAAEGATVAAKRAAEAAKRETKDAEAAALNAKRRDVEEAMAQLKESMEKQEDCLSWGGELKDLNETVSEAMHNPDSFEHMSTEFIVPTNDRFNVLMKFRGTNGFGAIVTSQVLTRMAPDSCEILAVSNPK
jgi:hypothetical protein